MARTALNAQQVTDEGLEAVYTGANIDGHSIDGTGDIVLDVVNGGGTPITVTVETGLTVDGLAVADRAVVVTNGERRHIGRFPPRTYNREAVEVVDPGRVWVNFSGITSVTIAALRV